MAVCIHGSIQKDLGMLFKSMNYISIVNKQQKPLTRPLEVRLVKHYAQRLKQSLDIQKSAPFDLDLGDSKTRG